MAARPKAKRSGGDEDGDDYDDAVAACDSHEHVDPDGKPNAVVIINLPDALFEENNEKSSAAKDEFEKIFRRFDGQVEISYLKRFQRAKLVFANSVIAAEVKECMNGVVFLGKTMKCYFVKSADATKVKPPTGQYLEPPTLEKQLLISPPTSPPDGWDPLFEREPAAATAAVNLDLVSAIAQLQPGGTQELCEASAQHPGLVVQVAPQEASCRDKEDLASKHPKLKMPQTRCPAWTPDHVA